VNYRNTIRRALAVITLAACASVSAWSQAAPKLQPGESIPNTKPSILDKVGLDQRLNQQVPLDLAFNDEHGQAIQLQQYFGQKPVILMLVYFQCPMLCTQVLSGFTGAMLGIRRFDIGREFNVITVSIDPRDKPSDAVAMKD
jgi:protein SCO1